MDRDPALQLTYIGAISNPEVELVEVAYRGAPITFGRS